MALDPKVAGLVERGRIGRKAKKGFHRYEGGCRKGVDPSVFADLGVAPPRKALGAEEAEARLVLPMVDEAALCLPEGVVAEPAKLDLAMIFVTGFPPFRGGPLRHADAPRPACRYDTGPRPRRTRLEASFPSPCDPHGFPGDETGHRSPRPASPEAILSPEPL